ncbi:hypothetical protein LF1_53700 [Rubripirellula obstinata]|uniref:SMI1 / KNR4 family protein n=2 Tax=Rubripirellula obstinata TaxID=406547 RepID=A0A5B1CAM7_9BACT|nr:hypothetical protein LF1_53700 [Rubripirellula obstinata]
MSLWVERAVSFTQSLRRLGADSVRAAVASPPLTASELDELRSTLNSQIPGSLAHFLCTESRSCNCEYYLTFQHEPKASAIAMVGAEMASLFAQTNVYGGASLCQSEHLADWNSESVLSVFDDIDRDCANLWRNTFLFKAISNADFLGLYIADDLNDPPVVYMDHEATIHRPIAPTLDHFLNEWEKLWYVGPEYWELENFIDPDTGYINADAGNLSTLHARFRGNDG